MAIPAAKRFGDFADAAERLQAKEISPFIGSVIGRDKKALLSGDYSAELRALIFGQGCEFERGLLEGF